MRFNLVEELDCNGSELTTEQAKFFAKSKVRDDFGNLLVCYRGAADQEDRSGFGSSLIRWFTTNKDYANMFNVERKNHSTYSVYLNCKKIFYAGVTDGRLFKMTPLINPELSNEFILIINKLNVSEDLFRKIFKKELAEPEAYNLKIFTIINDDKFVNIMKRSGYDCIKTIEESKYDCYGVFNNNSIKLISNETPTDNIGIDK